MFAVDGVPLDSILRDAEVEGILTHCLTAIGVVEHIISLVYQYLDGVLALLCAVGNFYLSLIQAWELFLHVLGELSFYTVITILTYLGEGYVHVPCLLGTVRDDELIFTIL